MKPDIRFFEGERDRPLAVFVHGMGVNADIWSDPGRSRVLGGRYPLSVLLGNDMELVSSFSDLQKAGFSVLTWSQTRPAGPIRTAVTELRELMEMHASYAHKGVVMICHSRGGLVARKYLEDAGPVSMLVTLATPHSGTSMAKWAVYVSPLATALRQLLDNFNKDETDTALQKVLGFLGSSGLKELLPDSGFYAGLKDCKRDGIRYLSAGGTNPDILRGLAVPLPELLARVVPERMLPEEMRTGRGDGLVSAASAVLPFADEHRDFPVNHAAIVFDRRVRDFVSAAAGSL